jgi:alditol oxidase
MTVGTNWAGNYTYRAKRLREPETIDELRRIVAGADRIHALGSRHSFSDIGDSSELISLDRIAQDIIIDADASTVTVSAGVKYGHLALRLEEAGYALHNMASLPHISVGGAVATATHGSGDRNGNLATAVVGLELVTGSGDLVRVTPDDPRFAGMVVHLGALGVVTRLTLRVEPSYLVHQQVFEHVSWDVALERFDEIMGSDDSVSLFTDFGDTINQVWRKHRVDSEREEELPATFMGAAAATENLHPVATLSAENCTGQLGAPGPWLHRLPHFRMESTPASGDEIQAEYMVARHDAVAALTALRPLGPELQPHLWVSEVRTVAGDDLWLSTAYGVDTVCLHFSFRSDAEAAIRLERRIEDALAPFNPRPHWGKVFLATADEIEPRYERMREFRALADAMDPRGAFRNAFLERHVFGG